MSSVTEKLSNLSLTPLSEIKNLSAEEGKTIKINGFVDSIRGMSKAIFYVLRDGLETVQCVYGLPADASDEIKEQFKVFKKLNVETYLQIEGKIVPAKVEKCTKKEFEIEIKNIKILGKVYDRLPFNLKDAQTCPKEQSTAKPEESRATVGYNVRLDNRSLDFRIPATHAMIRILDQTMFSFRDYLRKRDFTEIKTSKIIQSGSEGGANLFSVNYFDRLAYLAQSPQLYKQMAILGGMKRVYEIGHVYRAEVSNINRYLSEFTGLDIEMELDGDYYDFIHFVHGMFIHIFESFKTERSKELETIREYRHFEDLKYKEKAVIIKHAEAVDLLKAAGIEIGYEDDFSREQEKILGRLMKEKEDVDIFTVVDYPASVRAFYTYVDQETGKTRSYDFIVRGEEILSGAQRQTDHTLLKEAIVSKGINPETLNNYLEPFKYGAPPHIGCGIGLERLLKAFFGFDDIRYFALFPRDPNRIFP